MLKKFSLNGWRWLWLAMVVFLLDQFTKYLALHYLALYTPQRIFSFFNLTLAYNKGAAFSFLNNASGWQAWVFGSLALMVSIAILIWLKFISREQRWMAIALNLILGGALGNLFDRIHYGYVIDFIEFHLTHFYWPAFNIADSAICMGAVMILWDAFSGRKKKA